MQTMLIKQECSYEYTIIHLFTTVTDAWNQSWTVYQTRLDYIPNDIVTINEVKSQVLLPWYSGRIATWQMLFNSSLTNIKIVSE
jgi:hypothetical protein